MRPALVTVTWMAVVVGPFERYALGNISGSQLKVETGLAATRIRMIPISH